jgi:hypothetical protein
VTPSLIIKPRAILTQKMSSDIFVYIQSLKEGLLKEVGFDKDYLSFNEDGQKSVNKLFIKERKGVELFQKINSYKNSIIRVNPSIAQEFHNYSLMQNKDSIDVLFKNASILGALAVLTQFQNNVKIFENKIASFCNDQVTNNAFIIDAQPSPIIFQSSKYVKFNDELQISAGLGKFETRNNLRILINNKEIAPNDYGYSELKIKIISKPGIYSIPVRIEYTNQDANKLVVDRVIKYTVVN